MAWIHIFPILAETTPSIFWYSWTPSTKILVPENERVSVRHDLLNLCRKKQASSPQMPSGNGVLSTKGCWWSSFHHIPHSWIQLKNSFLHRGGRCVIIDLETKCLCLLQWMLLVLTSEQSISLHRKGTISGVMSMKIYGQTDRSDRSSRKVDGVFSVALSCYCVTVQCIIFYFYFGLLCYVIFLFTGTYCTKNKSAFE